MHQNSITRITVHSMMTSNSRITTKQHSAPIESNGLLIVSAKGTAVACYPALYGRDNAEMKSTKYVPKSPLTVSKDICIFSG